MDDTQWTKANWNCSDNYYLPGVTAKGVGQLSDVAMLSRRLYSAAGNNGYSILTLGNNIAQGSSGNALGAVRLYGTGTYYTILYASANTADRKCYLPNYDGTTHLAHTGNNNPVGDAETPVYVAANGRITSTGINLNNTYVKKSGDTMTGSLAINDATTESALSVNNAGGQLILYSHKTDNYSGLWAGPKGTDTAGKGVIAIDPNNNITFNGNAVTATKATQDSDGNTINSTYFKKS